MSVKFNLTNQGFLELRGVGCVCVCVCVFGEDSWVNFEAGDTSGLVKKTSVELGYPQLTDI